MGIFSTYQLFQGCFLFNIYFTTVMEIRLTENSEQINISLYEDRL